MKRKPNELTPKQVADLRKTFKRGLSGRQFFMEELLRLGYREIGGGVFKRVFSMNGRYVIKVGYGSEAHTNGTRIRKRYLQCPRIRLAPLSWGADFHVQRRVNECTCTPTVSNLRKYEDSATHNHYHVGGRVVMFDY